jgi:hypothetical protein
MDRCDAADCIAPATVSVRADDVQREYCERCFVHVDKRLERIEAELSALIGAGCHPWLANANLLTRVERREL